MRHALARRPARWALRVTLAAGAAALLARAFAGVDWDATWRVLVSAGPAAPLALVPFGVALLLDTSGVLLVARSAGMPLAGGAALAVRVVGEALHFSAPGGVVASEAAVVALYTKTCGLETREAMCVVARRKQLVMRAHAAYLALGASVGAGALAVLARSASPRAHLAWLVLASAAIPLTLSIAVGFGMKRAKALGATFARFAGGHLGALATLSFLAAWLVESVETAIVLRIAGIPMPMTSVLAVEAALSLARSAVAFLPGGLGVQDLGYAAALGALGVPHDRVAAFVLLKRAKELAWIGIGFAVSALVTRSSRAARRAVT